MDDNGSELTNGRRASPRGNQINTRPTRRGTTPQEPTSPEEEDGEKRGGIKAISDLTSQIYEGRTKRRVAGTTLDDDMHPLYIVKPRHLNALFKNNFPSIIRHYFM